jgi:hypothetical protein
MLRNTIATATALLALFSFATSAEATDSKIYNGSGCRQVGESAYQAAEYTFLSGAIMSRGRYTTYFACPIIRDMTRKHLKNAWVYIHTNNNQYVSCSVMKTYGNPFAGSLGKRVSSTASGSRKLWLGSIDTSSFASFGNSYSILCRLPNLGTISLYGADEDS